MIAGIDYSSRAVDIVLLDEDTDAAEWHRFELRGNDAFDRARDVRNHVPARFSGFWDEVIAVGIEDPRGYGSGSLYRMQGAILPRLPNEILVHPWIPSAWRKAVGLPGHAEKARVKLFADVKRLEAVGAFDEGEEPEIAVWPQDACDAFCIALATRQAIQVTA